MANVTPYLQFNGNCREAMNFYKDCLGGELELMTFSEAPAGGEMPGAQPDQVMHSALNADGISFFAADMGKDASSDNIALCISATSVEQLETYFQNLATGASMTQPIKEEFFGHFGALVDKFGISWMFMAESQQQ
jgi:PhnB protein